MSTVTYTYEGPITDRPLVEVVGGDVDFGDELAEAVLMSLFTWRRSDDDPLPVAGERQGWWGDAAPAVAGDQVGSRLWLLSRSQVTAETVQRARSYGAEALAWLELDGVAAAVDVTAARVGLDGIALEVVVSRRDGRTVALRFQNLWEAIGG